MGGKRLSLARCAACVGAVCTMTLDVRLCCKQCVIIEPTALATQQSRARLLVGSDVQQAGQGEQRDATLRYMRYM